MYDDDGTPKQFLQILFIWATLTLNHIKLFSMCAYACYMLNEKNTGFSIYRSFLKAHCGGTIIIIMYTYKRTF